MQVPERLALIGGSILLSSTLIFTLKSQASSIIPNVSHSISGVFDHIGDAQKSSDFDDNFKQAQQKGWTTGYWGTAKYYIDNQMNMYVGSGQLDKGLNEITNGKSSTINSLNILGKVKAPNNSISLFAANIGSDNHTLYSINGLENVDTSDARTMSGMFQSDYNVTNLNISRWNTSNNNSVEGMFYGTHSLRDLDLSHWDTHNIHDMGHMLSKNESLFNLNLSNWDTSHISEKFSVFNDTNIKNLTLNSNFQVRYDMGLSGTYKNGNQTLSASQLQDNSSHPGTWIKQ